jgi:hypothetical protein
MRLLILLAWRAFLTPQSRVVIFNPVEPDRLSWAVYVILHIPPPGLSQ